MSELAALQELLDSAAERGARRAVEMVADRIDSRLDDGAMKLYSLKDAAKRHGVKPRTLRSWVDREASNGMRSERVVVRIGSRRWIDDSAFERWLERGKD